MRAYIERTGGSLHWTIEVERWVSSRLAKRRPAVCVQRCQRSRQIERISCALLPRHSSICLPVGSWQNPAHAQDRNSCVENALFAAIAPIRSEVCSEGFHVATHRIPRRARGKRGRPNDSPRAGVRGRRTRRTADDELGDEWRRLVQPPLFAARRDRSQQRRDAQRRLAHAPARLGSRPAVLG